MFGYRNIAQIVKDVHEKFDVHLELYCSQYSFWVYIWDMFLHHIA